MTGSGWPRARLHLSDSNVKQPRQTQQPSLRAKRSNPCNNRKERLDCFGAHAPRNDVKMWVHIPAARYARVVYGSFAPKRAWGMPDAQAHPQPRVGKIETTRVSPPRSRRLHPAFPHANGFNGFLRALLGDRAFLPPSSAEVAFRQLDASIGASGPHDFAVRLSMHSSRAPQASTASRATFVTIAKRPFVHGHGTAGLMDLIWAKCEAKYFYGNDWTGSISLIGFDKFAVWRKLRVSSATVGQICIVMFDFEPFSDLRALPRKVGLQ